MLAWFIWCKCYANSPNVVVQGRLYQLTGQTAYHSPDVPRHDHTHTHTHTRNVCWIQSTCSHQLPPNSIIKYKTWAYFPSHLYNSTLTSFEPLICCVTYLLTPWSRVLLEKLTSFRSKPRNSPHFMEPEGSLPYSLVLATCPYTELTPSSPHDPLQLPEN
jgi:hypothetical protein